MTKMLGELCLVPLPVGIARILLPAVCSELGGLGMSVSIGPASISNLWPHGTSLHAVAPLIS